MIWVAFLNNITELFLAVAWSSVCVWMGLRIGRWLERRRLARKER